MVLGVAGAREQQEGDDVSDGQHGDAPESRGVRWAGRCDFRRSRGSIEHVYLVSMG